MLRKICQKTARSAKAGLLLSGIGLFMASNGFAGDACTTTSCAPAATSCDNSAGGGDECDWCNLGEPFKLHDYLCGTEDTSGIDFGGWEQFGYTTKSDGVFNTHPDHVDLQQSWLYVEKKANGECGWGWGFRGDLVYGTDAQNTQAFGNNPGNYDYQNGFDHGVYGWAFPQAYVEVANGPLSVKLGHFFTILGYEVVPATGNFFYSHAFTMNFSEPFTHTGALATYKASENVDLYGGWTQGWDTGFDQNNGGSSFLGGTSVKLTENAKLIYTTTIGDFGWRGEGYSHSIILDKSFLEKWNYVFQTDYVNTNLPGDVQYGVNQYLFYTVNDCLKYGVRGEWWSNDGDSVYEVTAGVNYKPMANLVVRPEIRHQWADDETAINNFGIPVDQTIFGVDAILTF